MSRNRRRILWFSVCVVSMALATIGAMIFRNNTWFGVYLFIGVLVAVLATLWLYGKL